MSQAVRTSPLYLLDTRSGKRTSPPWPPSTKEGGGKPSGRAARCANLAPSPAGEGGGCAPVPVGGGSGPLAERILVAALSVGVDLLCGEPPARAHPVVWMGRLIEAERRVLPRRGSVRQLATGGAVVACNVSLAAIAGGLLARLTGRWSRAPRVLARAAILSTLMSLRMLAAEAARVRQLGERGDLAGAREAVRSLVSRETRDLAMPDVLAAAVESVAENASDSVVAPLLAYVVAGLPGASVYRMANTMDAMLGYHGEYEHLGKAAARLDDLLNWVPARLTAGLLLIAAPCIGGSGARGWVVLRHDHRRTASPNAGWPMSAAAGVLGVRLEKVGHYVLGSEFPPPEPMTVRRAVRLVEAATAVLLAALGVVALAGSLASGRRAGRRRRRR